jgi:DNA-binding XRE family transcriptional regulator/desulfoferrodoxin (superoxide reductase-like protein)
MNEYVTGTTIRALREKKGLTQRVLAERIGVSDKAVSKWETMRGLPDITLLEPLAQALGVSAAELLRGECAVNRNRCGNLAHASFYVCPICGNVLYALGEGAYSCCGVTLPPLEAEPAAGEHALSVKTVDGEWYVSLDHPMEKTHYLSFMALASADRIQFVKLYPEQTPAARFAMFARGTLYVCCNRHGLFSCRL